MADPRRAADEREQTSEGPEEADQQIAEEREEAEEVESDELGEAAGQMSGEPRTAEERNGEEEHKAAEVVFLLDVDNTLLDNDRVNADLKRRMNEVFGTERQQHYWKIFEERREELGYSDYLGTLQRLRIEYPADSRFLRISFYLVDYPFANRLFPAALDVLDHLGAWGPTVILSDGDVIFQPRKVERSGLYESVEGRVLIYIHKERHIADIEKCYPALHYVLVDDKLRILSAFKKVWGARLTTVFPRQGHYAHDQKILSSYPPADISLEHIGDLLGYSLPDLLRAAKKGT